MWWYCCTDGFYAEAYGCMEAIGCHLGPTPSIDETVHTNAVTLRAASEPLVTSSAHEQHTMPSGGTNGKGRGGVTSSTHQSITLGTHLSLDSYTAVTDDALQGLLYRTRVPRPVR